MVSNRLQPLGGRLLLKGLSDASRRGTACAAEQQQPFPNCVSPPSTPCGTRPRGPTLPPQPHRISAASRRMLPRMWSGTRSATQQRRGQACGSRAGGGFAAAAPAAEVARACSRPTSAATTAAGHAAAAANAAAAARHAAAGGADWPNAGHAACGAVSIQAAAARPQQRWRGPGRRAGCCSRQGRKGQGLGSCAQLLNCPAGRRLALRPLSSRVLGRAGVMRGQLERAAETSASRAAAQVGQLRRAAS